MSKSRKKLTIAEKVVDAIFDHVKKPIEIRGATLKDGCCPYEYEVMEGVGKGDTHGVKAKSHYKNDLAIAFAVLNVHLAVVDDVFKHSGIEIDDIDKFHGHELATIYKVTGFKVKGYDENEGVVLIGTKYLSIGGYADVESPKIALDKGSSYKWYNELKAAFDKARYEVELYKDGKCEPVEEEEEKPNPKQTKLFGANVEVSVVSTGDGPLDEDFQNAVI